MVKSILAFLLGILIGKILILAGKKIFCDERYCNSSYQRDDKSLVTPEYEVHNIERTYTKNGFREIAKYTLWNFYLSKKNKVSFQELIIYDEIGKYNIGDKLTLTCLK